MAAEDPMTIEEISALFADVDAMAHLDKARAVSRSDGNRTIKITTGLGVVLEKRELYSGRDERTQYRLEIAKWAEYGFPSQIDVMSTPGPWWAVFKGAVGALIMEGARAKMVREQEAEDRQSEIDQRTEAAKELFRADSARLINDAESRRAKAEQDLQEGGRPLPDIPDSVKGVRGQGGGARP